MWHAFDIIADAMGVSPGLRSARADGPGRLVYAERVVRWFKDKSGRGQWPAVVDDRPGIVIERPVVSGKPSDWTLRVEHVRMQTAPATLRMQLTCASDPWRSPRHWEATHTLGDQDHHSPLAPTIEQGDWDGRRLTRRVQGKSGRVIEQVHDTQQPACLYALLADFPVKSLKLKGFDHKSCDALFTEAMQQMGGASFIPGAPGNAAEHRLAEGLTCYRVTPTLGFPLEFWVNEHGMVVYLIEGATRAWVIKGVEALT